MQKFFRFWKKDFINKLIVLVVLLIAAAVAIDLFLLMRSQVFRDYPPGRSVPHSHD